MPKSLRGFTLVELLVVISIIAILAVAGVIVFSNLQKNGRDAKRQSDLRVIQSALEQYHADQGYYPLSPLNSSLQNPDGTKTYNSKLPTDPINSGNFNYLYKPKTSAGGTCDNVTSSTTCQKYCFYSKMENTDNGLLLDDCVDETDKNYEIRSP